MLGGLSTQGGFLGNAGGLAAKYPLGLVGQIGGINEDIVEQMKMDESMGLAGAIAANPFGGLLGSMTGGLLGSMTGGTQMGNAGSLSTGMAGSLVGPMTIKKVF